MAFENILNAVENTETLIDTKVLEIQEAVDTKQQQLTNPSIEGLETLDSTANIVDKSYTQKAADAVAKFDAKLLKNQISQQEEQLRTGFSDPSAFMSDEFSRTGAGVFINTVGAFASGGGNLIDSVISLPKRIIENAPKGPSIPTGVHTETLSTINKYIANPIYQSLDLTGNVISNFADRLHNDSEMQRVYQEASQAYDDNTGAVDIAFALANTIAVENPENIPVVIAQSLPHMYALATRGSLFAATYLGMVNERVEESTQIFNKAYGRNPQSAEEISIIYAGAVVSTTIETIESRFLLGKTAKLRRAADAKTNKIGIRTVRDAATGGAAEFGQEGTAAFITGITGKQSSLTDPDAIKEGIIQGAIGAGAGATIKAGTGGLVTDIAETVTGAADLTKAGVEKVGAITSEARLDRAVQDSDNLTIAKIGLETDFTKLNTAEERGNKVIEVFDALAAIDEEATAETDPVKRKAILDAAQPIQEQFRAVLEQVTAMNAREDNQLTVKDAERVIAETSEEITEEANEAVQTVINTIAKGNTVEDATVTSIKGSKLFDILDTGQKELLDLYEDYSQNFDSLEKVQSDILQGNTEDGFLGIQQQQQRVASAIELGNKKAANTALKQLVALRDSQLEKLNSPPKNPKFKTHKDTFVASVTREIEALNSAINFLDQTVKQSFDGSILTDADLKKPTVEIFGGTEAKAEDTANEIAAIDAKIKVIQDSQVGRTESGPEAEAAIGAKQEEISRLAAKRDSLRRQQTKEISKPEPVSDQAKNQLSDLIDRLTDPKQKERAQAAFDRSTTKAHFERLRSNVRTALNKQQEKVDQESREAIESEAAAINEEARADTDTDVEVSVVGKIEGFDAVLEMKIPESTEYGSKNIKQRVKIGNRTLRNTYRSLIMRQDRVLRAVQEIVEQCNA